MLFNDDEDNIDFKINTTVGQKRLAYLVLSEHWKRDIHWFEIMFWESLLKLVTGHSRFSIRECSESLQICRIRKGEFLYD